MSYINNWTSTSQQEDNKVISSNLDDPLSVSDIDSDTSMLSNNSSKTITHRKDRVPLQYLLLLQRRQRSPINI